MAFDLNAWYKFMTVADGDSRVIRWCGMQITCFSTTNLTSNSAQWQLVPRNDSLTPTSMTTPFVFRNRDKGPDWAFAVSYGQNETQPGLQPLDYGDPKQRWDLVRMGKDSSEEDLWFIKNIANGTGYNLAERGDPMYMTSAPTELSIFTGTQTWIIRKVGDINDPVWSPTPSATPTASIGAVPSTTSDAGSHNNAGPHKMLGGAIAGTVLGTIFGIILVTSLIILAMRCSYLKRVRSTKRPNPLVEVGQINHDRYDSNTTTIDIEANAARGGNRSGKNASDSAATELPIDHHSRNGTGRFELYSDSPFADLSPRPTGIKDVDDDTD